MKKSTSTPTSTCEEIRESFTLPCARHPFLRVRVPTIPRGVSKTHQAHADSCDINKIISRFDRTGVLPPPTRPEQYADVTALQGDLTERINSSREILDKAGRALEQKQLEVKEKAAQKQRDLEDEVARLKSQNDELVKGQSSGAQAPKGSST